MTTTTPPTPAPDLLTALADLLDECIQAGHGQDKDYQWPERIAAARAAVAAYRPTTLDTQTPDGLVLKGYITVGSDGLTVFSKMPFDERCQWQRVYARANEPAVTAGDIHEAA